MSEEEEAIHLPPGLTTQGFLGRRYMARIIDSAIILCVAVATVLLIEALIVPEPSSRPWVAFVVLIGYGAVLESSPWQGTVGKRLFKLRVY